MSERTETKRLYRSSSNSQIAGVCGGLSEYFNIDATLIRILFIVLALGGGNGLFIYLVLWVIMPSEDSVREAQKRKRMYYDEYEDA